MKKRVYSKRIAAIGMAAAMTVGMHTGAFANDDVSGGNDIESVGGSNAGNSDNNDGENASESSSETDFNDSEEEEIGKDNAEDSEDNGEEADKEENSSKGEKDNAGEGKEESSAGDENKEENAEEPKEEVKEEPKEEVKEEIKDETKKEEKTDKIAQGEAATLEAMENAAVLGIYDRKEINGICIYLPSGYSTTDIKSVEFNGVKYTNIYKDYYNNYVWFYCGGSRDDNWGKITTAKLNVYIGMWSTESIDIDLSYNGVSRNWVYYNSSVRETAPVFNEADANDVPVEYVCNHSHSHAMGSVKATFNNPTPVKNSEGKWTVTGTVTEESIGEPTWGENDENNHVYVGHNIPETGVKTVTFEYKAGKWYANENIQLMFNCQTEAEGLPLTYYIRFDGTANPERNALSTGNENYSPVGRGTQYSIYNPAEEGVDGNGMKETSTAELSGKVVDSAPLTGEGIKISGMPSVNDIVNVNFLRGKGIKAKNTKTGEIFTVPTTQEGLDKLLENGGSFAVNWYVIKDQYDDNINSYYGDPLVSYHIDGSLTYTPGKTPEEVKVPETVEANLKLQCVTDETHGVIDGGIITVDSSKSTLINENGTYKFIAKAKLNKSQYETLDAKAKKEWGKEHTRNTTANEFELVFVRDATGHWSKPTVTVNYECEKTTPVTPVEINLSVGVNLHCITDDDHADITATPIALTATPTSEEIANGVIVRNVSLKDLYAGYDNEVATDWKSKHERETKDETVTVTFTSDNGVWTAKPITINYKAVNDFPASLNLNAKVKLVCTEDGDHKAIEDINIPLKFDATTDSFDTIGKKFQVKKNVELKDLYTSYDNRVFTEWGKEHTRETTDEKFEVTFTFDSENTEAGWTSEPVVIEYKCEKGNGGGGGTGEEETPVIPATLGKTVRLHCTTENSGHIDMEDTLELSTDGLEFVKTDAGYTLALTLAEKDYSKFDETVKAWDKDHERATKDTFTLTYVYDKESKTWVNNDEIVINYSCKNGGGQTEEVPVIPEILGKTVRLHCTTANSGHEDMEGTLELSTDGLEIVKTDAGYTLALTLSEKDYSKFDETVKAWDKDHERATKDTFTLTYVYDKENKTWVNNDEIVINYACKNSDDGGNGGGNNGGGSSGGGGKKGDITGGDVTIDDNKTPLAELPVEEETVEIPKEDVPLAELPAEEETVEIPEEEVPLAEAPVEEKVELGEAPATGDMNSLGLYTSAMAAALAALALSRKKKKNS